MHPIKRIQTIARAAYTPVRALGVAGVLLIGGGGTATVLGAQAAGATGGGGYHPTPTSQPEDCSPTSVPNGELDPCPTTTTTEAPTTTTEAPTTTTEAPTTTSTTIPANCGTCEDFNQILLAGTDPDPFNNYWNAVHDFAQEYHLDYDWAVWFIQDECDLHPPMEPTTTTSTTIPPTSTTSTTSTTVPDTTTSTTSTTVPDTTTSTILVTSTTSTLPPIAVTVPPTTAAPAAPVTEGSTPPQTGSLAQTGAESDVLAAIGGTGVITGTGLVIAAARTKVRNGTDKLRGKEVAAGGPDPIDPDDLGFDPTPLTGDEIDATDLDTLAESLLEGPKPLYVQGENRISEMAGYKSGGKNVPDILLPKSLNLNPDQTSPLVPVVAEIAPISAPIAPEVSDPFVGYKLAPQRFFDRGL